MRSKIRARGHGAASLHTRHLHAVLVLLQNDEIVAAAAALHVVVPRWVFENLAAHLVLGVVVMAALAVVLALCSEADAFVAASMTMVPLLPRLVFLVVGPAVDVKLFAMQAGMFGRAFAARFAPTTLLVATASACAVGLFVLRGG